MNKKSFNLVATLTTVVATAAIALVTYFEPGNAEAINASISIAESALIAICANFKQE